MIFCMTARGEDIDTFWFCLFDELTYLPQLEEMTKKAKIEADKFAKKRLLPSMLYQTLRMVIYRVQNNGILKHHEMNSWKSPMVLRGDL